MDIKHIEQKKILIFQSIESSQVCWRLIKWENYDSDDSFEFYKL